MLCQRTAGTTDPNVPAVCVGANQTSELCAMPVTANGKRSTVVKRSIKIATGDLLMVFECISSMLATQTTELKYKIEVDKIYKNHKQYE